MQKVRAQLYAGCYGTAYFAFVVLKLLFSTFSVSLVLQGFHLQLKWFYFGQAVLGAWNAVDDSLCAIAASYLHRGETAALRHVNAYLYAAPLLPVAFLFMFYPYSVEDPDVQGWQYVVALCFWDTVASYIAVSHSALGTDISADLAVRTACKRCEIGAITVTSFVIGIAADQYAGNNVAAFQKFVTVVAVLSSAVLVLTYYVLRSELLKEAAENRAAALEFVRREASEAGDKLSEETCEAVGLVDEDKVPGKGSSSGIRRRKDQKKDQKKPEHGLDGAGIRRLRDTDDSVWLKLRQTAQNRNFVCWVLMQWLVYCNTVFQTKFYHMFSQALFQGTPVAGLGGSLLSGAHVLRSLLTVFYVLPGVTRFGAFTVYRAGAWVQLLIGVGGGLIAYYFRSLLPVVYLLVILACSHKAVSSLFIADLSIEDQVEHLRPQSQAAFFFAIRSFFTVWGDSAVPVIVVHVLSKIGIDPSESMENLDGNGKLVLLVAWFGVPVVLAVLKLMVSSFYELHGKTLDVVREQRAALIQQDLIDKVR